MSATLKLGKPEVKPVLMEVLYGATSGTPGQVALRDSVKTDTFTSLGVDPTSLGQVANGQKAGTQKSDKLFNACFSELKKDGLVESPLRNRYALTDAGIRYCQAHGLMLATAPAPVETPITTNSVDEVLSDIVQIAPAPVQESEPTKQQNAAHKAWKTRRANEFTVADADPMQDAYLLSLMVASSPCFGVSPSSRSKTCKSCPAFSACTRARAARLSELAASLEAQAAAHQTVDVDVLAAPPVVEEPKVDLPGDAVVVPVEVEGVECDHCNEKFDIGTNGVILSGLGMYHENCVADALSAAKAAAGGV